MSSLDPQPDNPSTAQAQHDYSTTTLSQHCANCQMAPPAGARLPKLRPADGRENLYRRSSSYLRAVASSDTIQFAGGVPQFDDITLVVLVRESG